MSSDILGMIKKIKQNLLSKKKNQGFLLFWKKKNITLCFHLHALLFTASTNRKPSYVSIPPHLLGDLFSHRLNEVVPGWIHGTGEHEVLPDLKTHALMLLRAPSVQQYAHESFCCNTIRTAWMLNKATTLSGYYPAVRQGHELNKMTEQSDTQWQRPS